MDAITSKDYDLVKLSIISSHLEIAAGVFLEILKLFLSYADVYAKASITREDSNILTYAVACGRLETVEFLINQGYTIDPPLCYGGRAALITACGQPRPCLELVDYVLKCGASVLKPWMGRILERNGAVKKGDTERKTNLNAFFSICQLCQTLRPYEEVRKEVHRP